MIRFNVVLFILMTLVATAKSQDFRWQQRVEYDMDVALDVKTHILTGTQKLTYYNNSRDTLTKVYYHLFWNAFQPGSMMDVRSINLTDPDARIRDRISKLKDDEIGYQHVQTLKQDGKDVSYKVDGTILQHARSAYNMFWINGDLNIEVTPRTVKLPPYILISMPAQMIVF